MLRASAINSEERLVSQVIFCAFPYEIDHELLKGDPNADNEFGKRDVPFIRKLPPKNQAFADAGFVEWFCFQHQFTVFTKLVGDKNDVRHSHIEVYPDWYVRDWDEAMRYEKAIAILHSWFTFVDKKLPW